MKIKITFLLVLLSVSIIGIAQYSEWKEFGLKGPVQSVTSRFYTSKYFDAENLQLTDSSAWSHKTVRFFNPKGMVEWYFSTHHNSADTSRNAPVYTSYVSYAFDTAHMKISGAAYSKETVGANVISVSTENYRYNWLNPHNYIETVFDSSGTKLICTYAYELDTDFFITSEKHQYNYGTETARYSVEINYAKNSSGHIASCTEKQGTDEASSTKIYDYKTFDPYGNPTSFIVHVETGSASFDILAVKEYTYFVE